MNYNNFIKGFKEVKNNSMKKTILKMVFGEIFLINSQSGQQKNRTIKFEENSKKIIEI